MIIHLIQETQGYWWHLPRIISCWSEPHGLQLNIRGECWGGTWRERQWDTSVPNLEDTSRRRLSEYYFVFVLHMRNSQFLKEVWSQHSMEAGLGSGYLEIQQKQSIIRIKSLIQIEGWAGAKWPMTEVKGRVSDSKQDRAMIQSETW